MNYNVYLVSAEINNKKLYKIGYTRRSVKYRVKELKTGNAADFLIVETFESKWGSKIEAYLHHIYLNKKISGEWFDLEEIDVVKFKESCQTIHNNLEIISINNTFYLDKGKFY